MQQLSARADCCRGSDGRPLLRTAAGLYLPGVNQDIPPGSAPMAGMAAGLGLDPSPMTGLVRLSSGLLKHRSNQQRGFAYTGVGQPGADARNGRCLAGGGSGGGRGARGDGGAGSAAAAIAAAVPPNGATYGGRVSLGIARCSLCSSLLCSGLLCSGSDQKRWRHRVSLSCLRLRRYCKASQPPQPTPATRPATCSER